MTKKRIIRIEHFPDRHRGPEILGKYDDGSARFWGSYIVDGMANW